MKILIFLSFLLLLFYKQYIKYCFIVTVFIKKSKTIKLVPRGRPAAVFEISLFSLMKYQIPIMVTVGFGCTRVICCQGKRAKFQFREFPVLFFPERAVVCLSHPQQQLWEQGMGKEGLALPYVLGAGSWKRKKLTALHEEKVIACPCVALSKEHICMFFMIDKNCIDIWMATLKKTKSQPRPGSCLKLWQEQLLSQKYKNRSII